MSEDSNVRMPKTITVGGTEYNALSLARMTDADVPEYGSAGEWFLHDVASTYVADRGLFYDDPDWQDNIATAASDLSNLSTEKTWQAVTDLKLFNRQDHFDSGLYATQYDYLNTQTFKYEKHIAVEVSKIDDMLQWWLYEVASQLLYSLRQADLEANPVEDEDSEDSED